METSRLSFMMTVTSLIAACDASLQLIDLSHKIDENTIPILPISVRYNLTRLVQVLIVNGTVLIEGNMYCTGEHSGTHIDAPNHVRPVNGKDGASVAEVPLENTVAYGVMIDCSREAAKDSTYTVPVQKILDWERKNGRIPDGSAVLFNFGYSQYFVNNQSFYRGTDDFENLLSYSYPSISKEAGRFLIEKRDVITIGVDVNGPDIPVVNGQLSDFPIHRMLLSRGRILLENLNNLGQLPPRGFLFSSAPA